MKSATQELGSGLQVSIILFVNGHTNFVAKVHGEDLYGCIDGVIDKIAHRVSSYAGSTTAALLKDPVKDIDATGDA